MSHSGIDITEKFSAELDEQRNEAVEQQLDGIARDASPTEILARILSPNSTRISPLPRNLRSSSQTTVGYRVIGFGQCGLIFERPGRGYVLKIAKPSYESTLWKDFCAHFCVRQAFEDEKDLECRIPRIFSYISKNNHQWWDENRPFFTGIHNSLPLPGMVLVTERILPLPKLARQALIDRYCPQSLRPAASMNPINRDCLARIYLGRRRSPGAPLSPNFTLRNFNLCLDQMLELKLPVASYAAAIGEALAVVHWAAKVDAYDIEFVLGSEREDDTYTSDISHALRLTADQIVAMPPHMDMEAIVSAKLKRHTTITRMWVLDFNLCNMWEEKAVLEDPLGPEALIEQLIASFFDNDPYYPRPSMEPGIDGELWKIFSNKYLEIGNRIVSTPGKDGKGLHNLPQRFIDTCVEKELSG